MTQPGSQSPSHYQPRQHACRSADAVLLCYKISDPTTLFSALEQWAPAVRAVAPDTPIVLVGCQSELRFGHCMTAFHATDDVFDRTAQNLFLNFTEARGPAPRERRWRPTRR